MHFYYERNETPPLVYFRRNSTVELLSRTAHEGNEGPRFTGRKQSAINHAGYVSLSILSKTIHINGFS